MTEEFVIATTPQIERRRERLRKILVDSKEFEPDAIDIEKRILSFQKDNETIKEPVDCYNHLLDETFARRQISWVDKKIQANHYFRHRFILSIPDKHPNPDPVRQAWIEIQDAGGSPELYIPTNNRDTLKKLQDFTEKIVSTKPKNLVLQDGIPLKDLHEILPWAVRTFGEVIIVHNQLEGNEARYSLFLLSSHEYPDLFHLFGAPWRLTKHEKAKHLGVMAMTHNFKSVSFKDVPFPPYLRKHKSVRNRPPKELPQQIEDAVWLQRTLSYDDSHPECKCFGENGNDLGDMCRRTNIRSCQTHHLLELFSELFQLIKTSPVERERVLELDAMSSLVQTLIKGK